MTVYVRRFLIAFLIFLVSMQPIARADSSDTSSPHSQNVSAEDLGSPDKDARRRAKEALMTGGSNSVPTLLGGLDSSNQTVKIQALTILEAIKLKVKTLADDPIADHIGRKALHETDLATRVRMVHTLGDLRGPSATRELKRFASEDADMYIRADATEKIITVSGADESQFLRNQLKDPHEVVRLAAYEAMAQLGDKSGRDVALQELQKGPPVAKYKPYDAEFSRQEAIAILGYIASPADIGLLKSISKSDAESKSCQMSAYHSYHRAQLLQLPPEQRLDALIKALDDEPGARFWAYGELYRSKDLNTNARLKKYLNEPGHQGYKQAADALNSR